MAFQFRCPGGCVLEAEPEQAGQQCQCPQCGSVFVIPAPAGYQPSPAPAPARDPGAAAAGVEHAAAFPDVAQGGGKAAFDPFGQGSSQNVFHIPCPQGHGLRIPAHLLGTQTKCPICGVTFELREKDSAEYKRRRKEQQELKEYKSGKTWMNLAIILAILILGGLIFLIVASQ